MSATTRKYLYYTIRNVFITHRENLPLSIKATRTYCWEPFVDLKQESPLEINLEIDEHLGEPDSVYTSQDSDEEEERLSSGRVGTTHCELGKAHRIQQGCN